MSKDAEFGNSQMTDDEIAGVLRLVNGILSAHNLMASVIIPDNSGTGLHVHSVMCKNCHAKFLRQAADFIEFNSVKNSHEGTNEFIKP